MEYSGIRICLISLSFQDGVGETGIDFVMVCQQNWTDCKIEWLQDRRGDTNLVMSTEPKRPSIYFYSISV